MSDKARVAGIKDMLNGLGKTVAARYAAQLSGRCAKCDKVALRRVGAKGYCKEHMAAALLHRRKLNVEGEAQAQRRGTEHMGEAGER